jgi:hypothetical protein
MKTTARYSTSFGLSGCYLPDSHGCAFECNTRKELVSYIKSEIEAYELPKSMLRTVKINRLWIHIKAHGSSSAHFYLTNKGYVLQFHGLTEEEFNNSNEEL